MSHGHGDLEDSTCKFGHIIRTEGGSDELKNKIRSGDVESLSDLREKDYTVFDIFGGDPWKHLKVSSGSQGTALAAVFTAVDNLDTAMEYNAQKIDESVHIAPQSNFHQEFMQRKQQAEQNIKQTMQSYQQLIKQKHMLEHDIRKLRSRVEAIESKDETLLKGDFIELVDGAGQSPRQGGDQMSLKAYRDQNIYPSIVADFNEMESVEDLEDAEQRAERYDDRDADDLDDGRLSDLPRNEKAILKKKWKMYEQWKDLYGSEVSRKLDELKGQLKNVERSIEETKEWLEPYVRDAAMINRMGDQQFAHGESINLKGNSTMLRLLDFLLWKPMKYDAEHNSLDYADKDEATHYRVLFIKGVHANLASFEQPQSPADGPSAGRVKWFPGFVCRHVFENIIKPRADEHAELVDQMMKDYTGDWEKSDDAEKLKQARQDAELSVRQLREEIQDEVDDDVPIELSSQIRRVEDGLESIDILDDKYIDAIDSILEDELEEKFKEDEDGDSDMYEGFTKTLREFTGQVDPFYMKEPGDGLKGFERELRYDYYWDLKIGLGLYTMK
ncbi:MAG: hypothetical protein ABEK16_02590 [Candidatus Nanohalobium sp.]